MSVKSIVSIVCLTGIGMNIQAQDKCSIQGAIMPSPKNLTMHLYHYKPGTMEMMHDSCIVTNGQFSFEENASTNTVAFLTMPPDGMTLNGYMKEHSALPKEQLGIYLEKGVVKVVIKDLNIKTAVVSGTHQNEMSSEAYKLIWKYKGREEEISTALKAAGDDIAKRDLATKEYGQMVKERTKEVGAFIKTHPDALVSLDLLKRWVNPADDVDQAKEYYSYLSDTLKAQPSARKYASVFSKLEALSVGALAPAFELTDTAGTAHQLNDFRGKFVLVDFWASWCIPCRKETPALIKAYQTYKNRNFEIVSVSLDGDNVQAHKMWTDAVIKDGMTWLQLSDLKAWNSPVAQEYQIKAIPMNFLLDPQGKIIAKNVRGSDLLETLNKSL